MNHIDCRRISKLAWDCRSRHGIEPDSVLTNHREGRAQSLEAPWLDIKAPLAKKSNECLLKNICLENKKKMWWFAKRELQKQIQEVERAKKAGPGGSLKRIAGVASRVK